MSYHLTDRKKSWFRSPIVAIVLAGLCILGAVSVVRAFFKEREAAHLRNQYRDELAEMNARESELDAQITTLSTERGLEAEIRERYRVSKPGEELVVVVNNGNDASATKKLTWWQKLRMFVGI